MLNKRKYIFCMTLLLICFTACGKNTSPVGISPVDKALETGSEITTQLKTESKSENLTQATKTQNSTAVKKKSVGLANDDDMKTALKTLLTSGKYQATFDKYYVYDIDNNGVEEVIIPTGEIEADKAIYVFEYKDKKFTQIGMLPGSHRVIYGNSKDGGLLLCFGQMGAEMIDSITLKNGTLTTTNIIEMREVSKYTKLDYEVELTPYDITNYAPLG